MKSLLSMIVAILLLSLTSHAQSSEVATIPQGQTFNLDQNKFNPKDSSTLTANSTVTTNKALQNGNVYPVFVSKKGKLFIILKSKKSGNFYRRYLN